MLAALVALAAWSAAAGAEGPVAKPAPDAVAKPLPAAVASKPSPSPAQVNLKEALVKATEERNHLRDERDRLMSRQWLIAGYALLISLIAAWLGLKYLEAGPRSAPEGGSGTDFFPNNEVEPTTPTGATVRRGLGTTATVRRGNATITVRDTDQQVQTSGKLETRRLFKSADPGVPVAAQPGEPGSAVVRKSDTRRVAAADETAPRPAKEAARADDGEPRPQTDRQARTPQPATETRSVFRKPPTEFLRNPQGAEQEPPTSEPGSKSVFRKPATSRVPRPNGAEGGFSLIEIMISIAVLATIMAALTSSMFTMSQIRRANKEQNQVAELTRLLAERIMGANWDWIGRDRPDEGTVQYQHGAWSWHRPHYIAQPIPLTESDGDPVHTIGFDPRASGDTGSVNDLQALKLVDGPTGIANLKIYVEYYRASVFDDLFTASGGTAPFDLWKARTDGATATSLYAFPSQLGLFGLARDEALIVRVLMTWDSVLGGPHAPYELVFMRRK
jgi:prepilin-type N-terminal cleavage/methylation domain-containing protein